MLEPAAVTAATGQLEEITWVGCKVKVKISFDLIIFIGYVLN